MKVVRRIAERTGYAFRAFVALGRRPWVCPEGHKVTIRRAATTGACKHGHPIFEELE